MAQLGARLHGMQKVMGSTPIGSIRLAWACAHARSWQAILSLAGQPTDNLVECLERVQRVEGQLSTRMGLSPMLAHGKPFRRMPANVPRTQLDGFDQYSARIPGLYLYYNARPNLGRLES